MNWDVFAILTYFGIVLFLGLIKRSDDQTSSKEFFLKSNSLRWPSVALSTIATNIHAGHFIGMAGSAYLFGIAQANFEINAVQGILIAAFLFVPFYLKEKVTTVSQFLEIKLGRKVGLTYSILMILLYSCLYLGSILFWGAYAINAMFPDAVAFLGSDPMQRIFIIAVALGAFSAFYTYLGGLGAVVRTDMVQLVLLLIGGGVLTYLSIDKLGGWGQLYGKTEHLMHLHLPVNHPKLPWPAIFGMLLLNLNYWGCNQVILQRALAAKNLFHAQMGLVAGGFLKYLVAVIIIVPAIALAGILAENSLQDPDMTYPTLIRMLVPEGLRGLILTGLFASLMSSADSIYHSVSTLWSVDIYRGYINPDVDDRHVVVIGKRAIWATFFAGALFAWINVYVKFENPDFALTHWFNEFSYYAKNGFVMLVIVAIFFLNPNKQLVLFTLIGSVLATILFEWMVPGMNYLNRSTIVILLSCAIVGIPSVIKSGWPLRWKDLIHVSTPSVGRWGLILAGTLIACHILLS